MQATQTLFLCLGLGAMVTACGSSKTDSAFNPPDAGSAGADGAMDDVGGSEDTGPGFGGDSSTTPTPDSGTTPPAGVPYVYAHSPTQLYRLNPSTKAVSVVGTFSGACALDTIIDIALDASSNAYVTGFGGFYKVDLATAACTLIAMGSNYPNSLSFVPKGTLDPNKEALVGYQGSTYVRIDTTSGAISNVGNLTGGYQSSGDIVSVIGGGTFLTVNGNACGDCLLQVNPKTGDLIQNYGSVQHPSVFGLAFWAGTVYGFDDGGQVFSIDYASGSLVMHDIPVPNPPAGLEFYGAGSTTSAPPAAPDGGGIPIQ